ncbi:cyclopropane fatty acyl phospholipid synthase [Ilumatobacter nonamiensis]|uniref:cyclopropane fatty acyl phospholipid synthase n=1 Tax=Ilumatobacter nonamiensis TaxID=467093 RepID=UPI000687C382|nr:cyclopropane fatty acyl phospholipid synthase [Ilumatobacter nonamiensis]
MTHTGTGTAASRSRVRRYVAAMLAPADIRLDGDRPWDVRVHDERTFRRVLTAGTLGLGESYMDGWWDCAAIDQLVERSRRLEIDRRLSPPLKWARTVEARVRNLQSPRRAFEVGERHYDIGNDLYERMLDRRMIYSCGYWRDATDLDQAQEAKLTLVANKLGLEPGMRVLDIGCGWGGAAQFFAERYGCDVVAITISKEQAALAGRRCADLPVEIRIQDYRDVDERFDRIYSIGMFEHVGIKNYRAYMNTVRRCLSDPDGLTLLHTIGTRRSATAADPWIARYIFPNSLLPSAKQITAAAEDRLVLEDWHNFGVDYDRTLMNWHERISRAWGDLPRYDERFRRMWDFYLLSSAGSFRSNAIHLWQIVFSRDGLPTPYHPDNIR